MAPSSTPVTVEGRELKLSNLDKVLYPQSGTHKGEVIDYYTRIAPVLLPHLTDRPLTRKRWPDGVSSQPFFEKNAPRGTPAWVRRVVLPSPGSTKDRETVEYVLCDDLPTLVWLSNLAVLELHVPQWSIDEDEQPLHPDRLVVDLDPGPPANVIACAQVALLLRERLARDGLVTHAKSSGNKGMQLMVALDGSASSEQVSAYARRLAEELESRHPQLVLSRMDRHLRQGKVFIDWSQNTAAKTTVAPYSLRGRETPTVSTPVTWDEVGAAAVSKARTRLPLTFTFEQVLDRVQEHGDLMAGLLVESGTIPSD